MINFGTCLGFFLGIIFLSGVRSVFKTVSLIKTKKRLKDITSILETRGFYKVLKSLSLHDVYASLKFQYLLLICKIICLFLWLLVILFCIFFSFSDYGEILDLEVVFNGRTRLQS